MELAAFVPLRTTEVVFRLACTELAEVFCCTRYDICEELHLDSAERLTTDCDIEEDDLVRFSRHLRVFWHRIWRGEVGDWEQRESGRPLRG